MRYILNLIIALLSANWLTSNDKCVKITGAIILILSVIGILLEKIKDKKDKKENSLLKIKNDELEKIITIEKYERLHKSYQFSDLWSDPNQWKIELLKRFSEKEKDILRKSGDIK